MTGKQKAISIHNLSKSYAIGKQKDASLRNSLAGFFKKKETKVDTFWALKGISFDVEQGEVIGIIGRNGAGKSTLLKVLSKITQPTTGRIEINGRVASLLEVGTGFHPELTGRENIYLNGTLLGMSRKEVAGKLEEIVEFSGVRKFIDTPVKHYSSGMYVRLAFSVAAHLEPEILIIDEVLAVGDAEFQAKCLGKMKDVAGEGRTVIFVSHDLSAVQKLCDRAVFLSNGKVEYDGSVHDCIEYYINSTKNEFHKSIGEVENRKGIGEFIFSNHSFSNSLKKTESFKIGETIILELEIFNKYNNDIHDFRVDLGLNNSRNKRLSWISSTLHNKLSLSAEKEKKILLTITIEELLLVPGHYDFNLNLIVNGENQDWIANVCRFETLESPFFASGKLPPNNQGDMLLKHSFKINKND